jgi:hypothetical protein
MDGGKLEKKELPYATPQGPTSQMHKGPGLGGDTYNPAMPVCNDRETGSPGLGGSNHGNNGTQGRH